MVRRPRDPERGNSLVLAMIVLIALGALSTFTMFSVRGGVETGAADRFHTIALYAAESGAAAAMDYLRTNIDPANGWATYVRPYNGSGDDSLLWSGSGNVQGDNVLPGDTGNPFSTDQQAYYDVKVLNNQNDTGYAAGTDDDHRIIVRSTGYGPNGAVAVIEWEIKSAVTSVQRPCPGYAQKGESEDNAGRNDCLGPVNTADTGEY
jgi:hypothetical protein